MSKIPTGVSLIEVMIAFILMGAVMLSIGNIVQNLDQSTLESYRVAMTYVELWNLHSAIAAKLPNIVNDDFRKQQLPNTQFQIKNSVLLACEKNKKCFSIKNH